MWPSAFVVVVQRQGDGAGVLRFWAYVPRQKLLCHAYLEIQLEVSTVPYRYSWDSWVPARIVKKQSGMNCTPWCWDTLMDQPLLPLIRWPSSWKLYLVNLCWKPKLTVFPASIFYHLLLTFDRVFVGNWGYVLLLAAGVVMNQASRTSVAQAEVLGNFVWRTYARKLTGSGERPKACHAQRSNGSCFLGGTLGPCCAGFSWAKPCEQSIFGCLWSWTNTTWVECPCLQGTSPALVHWSHSATCHRNWLSPISVNQMNLFPSLHGPRALTHCGENGILARLCRSKPMEWMGYSAS